MSSKWKVEARFRRKIRKKQPRLDLPLYSAAAAPALAFHLLALRSPLLSVQVTFSVGACFLVLQRVHPNFLESEFVCVVIVIVNCVFIQQQCLSFLVALWVGSIR